MKLTFIELPLFTSLIVQVADDSFLTRLQHDLLKNPEKGDLIPRLHGLRKVRMDASECPPHRTERLSMHVLTTAPRSLIHRCGWTRRGGHTRPRVHATAEL